ncbi:hypothetical protein PFISCL1PPCAC_2553, partial [Pristionchus fissidentatus]
ITVHSHFDTMESSRSSERLVSYGSISPSPPPLFSPLTLSSRVISVALICLINTLTCWDRYVTAGVLNPIIAYYGITDATGGLLQSAFIVVYIITLAITGWLGDHSNRKHLLLFSFTAWFLAVAASSFVPRESFLLFFLLRSLSAIGDASVKVIAPALFADYFKGKERGYAIMLFFASIPLGISIGMIIGSIITDSTIDWQWSLRAAPVFGLPLLIISSYLIEEPQRGSMETEGRILKETSHWEDIRACLAVKTFVFSIVGASFLNMYGRAVAWWGPTLLLDAMKYKNYDESIYHGISFATIQSFSSAMSIVSGLLGTTACVFLAESWSLGRCLSIGRSRSSLLVASFGVLLAVPLSLLSLESISFNLYMYLGANFVAPTVMGGTFPLLTEAILNVVSPSDRAMASALFNLVGSITGDGPAPLLVGQLSDMFAGGETHPAAVFLSLQKALIILSTFSAFGVIFLFLAAWSYPEDVRRREELTEEASWRGLRGEG